MTRKIIQISTVDQRPYRADQSGQLLVYALCDDGTVWVQCDWGRWQEQDLPPGCSQSAKLSEPVDK